MLDGFLALIALATLPEQYPMPESKRDLLSAAHLTRDEIDNLLQLAERIGDRSTSNVLAGKTVGLVFFNRSLRTRVSFEVATVQLGGHCIHMTAPQEIYDLEPEEQVVMDGRAEEHVMDAARTLSRYVDLLGIRMLDENGDWQSDRKERVLHGYAQHASVPVVNLESVLEHPCQALADVYTMRKHLLRLQERKVTIAWSHHPERRPMGPAHSLLTMATTLGMDVTVAHPMGFDLDPEVLQTANQRADQHGGKVRVVHDLKEGLQDADVVYSRAWSGAKYWDDPEREAIVKRSLDSWRIDNDMLANASDKALFMHPLPVRRNVVATDDVLDGPQSIIYEQAGNRVPAQKALLTHLLG